MMTQLKYPRQEIIVKYFDNAAPSYVSSSSDLYNRIPDDIDYLGTIDFPLLRDVPFATSSFKTDLSARFEGWLTFPKKGKYELCTQAIQNSTLYINGEIVLQSSKQKEIEFDEKDNEVCSQSIDIDSCEKYAKSVSKVFVNHCNLSDRPKGCYLDEELDDYVFYNSGEGDKFTFGDHDNISVICASIKEDCIDYMIDSENEAKNVIFDVVYERYNYHVSIFRWKIPNENIRTVVPSIYWSSEKEKVRK